MPSLELTAPWIGPVALALVTAALAYAFGTRQEQQKERRARRLAAATELASALRNLQRVVRRHGHDNLSTDEVSDSFMALARACDNHTHRLPVTYQHIGRSVRDATGTVFGGVSLVHLRPDTQQLDLATPHRMWQDFADDYLDYLARSLLEWGDSERTGSKDVMTYHSWLLRTERRQPVGNNSPACAQAEAPSS
jgi:hypothetical protein